MGLTRAFSLGYYAIGNIIYPAAADGIEIRLFFKRNFSKTHSERQEAAS